MKKLLLSTCLLLIAHLIYAQVETRFFPQKDAFDKIEKIKNNSKAQKVQKMSSFNKEQ